MQYNQSYFLGGVCVALSILKYQWIIKFQQTASFMRKEIAFIIDLFTLKLMPIKIYSFFNPPLLPDCPINARNTKSRADIPIKGVFPSPAVVSLLSEFIVSSAMFILLIPLSLYPPPLTIWACWFWLFTILVISYKREGKKINSFYTGA